MRRESGSLAIYGSGRRPSVAADADRSRARDRLARRLRHRAPRRSRADPHRRGGYGKDDALAGSTGGSTQDRRSGPRCPSERGRAPASFRCAHGLARGRRVHRYPRRPAAAASCARGCTISDGARRTRALGSCRGRLHGRAAGARCARTRSRRGRRRPVARSGLERRPHVRGASSRRLGGSLPSRAPARRCYAARGSVRPAGGGVAQGRTAQPRRRSNAALAAARSRAATPRSPASFRVDRG